MEKLDRHSAVILDLDAQRPQGYQLDMSRDRSIRVMSYPPPDALSAMRAAYTDALLPGIWTRDGVRLNAAGTVKTIDDQRCSTLSGRLALAGVAGERVTIPSSTVLSGAALATIGFWFTPSVSGANDTILGMFDGPQRGIIRLENNALTIYVNGGVQRNSFPLGAVAGTTYKVFVVYDLAQATAAAKVRCFAATWNPSTQAFAALAELGASSSSVTATALNAGAGVMCIGNRDAGGSDPFRGFIDELRAWDGTALTQAQIDAETLAVNAVPCALRFAFSGDYTNSGTAGHGCDGVATTGAALCSDDRRWGPPLLGAGGAANPTWDATNRLVVCDGASQYLRALGVFGTGPVALALIATMPQAQTISNRRFVAIGNGATDTLNVLVPSSVNTYNVNGGSIGVVGASSVVGLAGVRALYARTTNSTTGTQLGTSAEVTGAGTQTLAAANRLTIAANGADVPSVFMQMSLAGFFLYTGDFANKAALSYALARALGATL